MLHDVIFSLPDGRDAIVRLDTTLDKNEIRVGSLGALDQFVSDSAGVRQKGPRASRTSTKLSQIHVDRAHEWLRDNINSLKPEEKLVMTFFFPQGKTKLVSSKEVYGDPRMKGINEVRARDIRNRILRKAGILS